MKYCLYIKNIKIDPDFGTVVIQNPTILKESDDIFEILDTIKKNESKSNMMVIDYKYYKNNNVYSTKVWLVSEFLKEYNI